MDASDLDASQTAVLLTLNALPPTKRSTRLFFEKVLFLLTKNLSDQLPDLNTTFEAYKFGPYNEYADEIIDGLGAVGLIDQGVPTPEGEEVARSAKRTELGAPIARELERIVSATADLETDDILYLVYKLYPDYAAKSEIRHHVRSGKLEHFSIPVDNLREGESLVVSSDKGSELRVQKKDGKLHLAPARG